MSIYLEQIPASVNFTTPNNSLGVSFEKGKDFFSINLDTKISVDDIDWLIDSIRSVKNIVESSQKTK